MCHANYWLDLQHPPQAALLTGATAAAWLQAPATQQALAPLAQHSHVQSAQLQTPVSQQHDPSSQQPSQAQLDCETLD